MRLKDRQYLLTLYCEEAHGSVIFKVKYDKNVINEVHLGQMINNLAASQRSSFQTGNINFRMS